MNNKAHTVILMINKVIETLGGKNIWCSQTVKSERNRHARVNDMSTQFQFTHTKSN